jgi:hypothetical protein
MRNIDQLEPLSSNAEGEHIEQILRTDLEIGLDGLRQMSVDFDGQLDLQCILFGSDSSDAHTLGRAV